MIMCAVLQEEHDIYWAALCCSTVVLCWGGVEVKLGHHLLLLGGHCSTWAHENTGLWTCPRTGKKDDESFNYSIYLSYDIIY